MQVIKVTKKKFKEEVLEAQELVVVHAHLDWCIGCDESYFAKVANKFEGDDLKFVSIEMSEIRSGDLGKTRLITIFPTILFIKNGEELKYVEGADGYRKLEKTIKKVRGKIKNGRTK